MSPSIKCNKFIVLLFLFFSILLSAQTNVDTIQQKSYNEIYGLYNKVQDSVEKGFYAGKYLEKAKEEKYENGIWTGYYLLAISYSNEKKLQYADSIIDLTISNSNAIYPGYAYLIKGNYYYHKRAYKKALDNHLLASKYARKYNNKALIFDSNNTVGNIKRRTGNLKEALEIYKENLKYAEINKSYMPEWDYLLAISAVANTFNDMKNVDSASYYNKYGILKASKLRDEYHFSHFGVNQGVTHCHKGEYITAIDSLERYTSYFEKNKDITTYHQGELSFIYYYAGESYLGMNKPEIAIGYFKKVDTIFQKTGLLYPTLKETYTRLIDYYKKQKDFKNQVFYTDQLSKVDSILYSDQIYLNREVIKEYNLPKLKEEKESILKEMESKEKLFSWTFALLSILIVFLAIGFVFQYRKRKLYRKRFDEIIQKPEILPEESRNPISNQFKKLNIQEEIVENILKGLETFEKNKEFISSKTTLNSLAKKLQTNPNYLSRVVNHHKQVSFSNYLNNLRIEYAIDELQSNSSFRKYTLQGIALEVGFNNVQSFGKAFYKSKGINPSYFVRELKKIEMN